MFELRIRHILVGLVALGIFITTPFYVGRQVFAHDLTQTPWLLINGTDKLTYNPIPSTTASQFNYGEKIISLQIGPNDLLTFKVKQDVIESELGLLPEQVKYTWDFLDIKKFSGPNFETSFSEPGTYFLVVTIDRTDTNTILFSDTIMITVGTPPPAPTLLFNGIGVISKDTNVNRTFKIFRSGEMLFAVKDPATNRFKYEWDLADGDYIRATQATKQFENTKLPANIILRQTEIDTGLISENYVILTSDDDQQFKVVRPAANELANKDRSSNDYSYLVVVIAILLVGFIIVGYINRNKFLKMTMRILAKGKSKLSKEGREKIK